MLIKTQVFIFNFLLLKSKYNNYKMVDNFKKSCPIVYFHFSIFTEIIPPRKYISNGLNIIKTIHDKYTKRINI